MLRAVIRAHHARVPRLSDKTTANLVIGLVLAILVVTPLSYYTVRSDRYDERFAWRMFSSIRMARCKVAPVVGNPPRPVLLRKTFHEAWINIARRGRRSVIRPMVEKICEDNPGQPVHMRLPCRHVEGKVTTELDGKADLCKGGLR